MKLVINKCYGGYGLSPLAVKELAKLKGKECYFYDHDFSTDTFKPITLQEATKTSGCVFSFTHPDINSVLKKKGNSIAANTKYNATYHKYELDSRPEDRTDHDLISVVKKLGKKANTRFSELRIVEIPDGINYTIEEYDGVESVHECHDSWG